MEYNSPFLKCGLSIVTFFNSMEKKKTLKWRNLTNIISATVVKVNDNSGKLC